MTLVALFSAFALLTGTIHGTVMRGPTAPVCRVGVPCSAPAKHVTLYFTRSGSTRSTVTDGRGRYAMRLPAGVYSVKTNQRPWRCGCRGGGMGRRRLVRSSSIPQQAIRQRQSKRERERSEHESTP